MTKHLKLSSLTGLKDYVMIVFGIMLYAVGFTAFILPHKVVMGGLTGVGTLVYFATNGAVSVAISIYACNLFLLSLAYRIVGKQFVMRTIFGATVITLGIGSFENFFMSLGHPIVPDTTISCVLGAVLSGVGVGTVFIHNGSSGGTDIVAAMVSKVSNVSIGRTMIFVDMSIVACSIFLPFEGTFEQRVEARIPLIVYGLMVTAVIAYCTDMVINTNRQATQFMIFSKKWKDIAQIINTEAHRGVTVIDGMGWYSKQDIKILMVWCRRMESVTIFRIVKAIDDNAFITQGAVNGVYGQGFDTMRVKMKKHKSGSPDHTAELSADPQAGNPESPRE